MIGKFLDHIIWHTPPGERSVLQELDEKFREIVYRHGFCFDFEDAGVSGPGDAMLLKEFYHEEALDDDDFDIYSIRSDRANRPTIRELGQITTYGGDHMAPGKQLLGSTHRETMLRAAPSDSQTIRKAGTTPEFQREQESTTSHGHRSLDASVR